jgi:4-alpha-glucanotransferase
VRDEWGIEDRYTDASGREHQVPAETIQALREAMGKPAGERAHGLVVRAGQRVRVNRGELQLEDGTVLQVEDSLPEDLPYGYHTLRSAGGDPERPLIYSPGRCHLPPAWRAWGWTAQLYATRSETSWGIGDFGDLRRLARWSQESLGAGFVMVNPLHASAPTLPQQASPYFPSSRRFRNPIYLRIEQVPGADLAARAVEVAGVQGRALNQLSLIERDEVWRLKLRALEAIWERAGPSGDYEQWAQHQGQALQEFTTWCALAERFGGLWRTWPSGYRHPASPRVKRFRRENRDRVRFHSWLQWLTAGQLAAATTDLAIIQDLAIGVDPSGADAWAWQDLFADSVTVGAPPDQFLAEGQNWGLPPFVPHKLKAAGYQPFIDTIRASFAAGGGLRLDHVIGLFRLWWVPKDAGAIDGAYVRYPHEDLLNIVALESHRARALVVGEDLGTVEQGVREELAERNVLSYRLLWFEEREPARWPELAFSAITTHDLPSVAGIWTGSDLKEQRDLGLEPSEQSNLAIRNRLAGQGRLAEDAGVEKAVLAAHRLLAGAPSVLLGATLEDALALPERPNIPGTDGLRPNWSLALPMPLEEIESAELPRKVAEILRESTQPR